MIGHQDEGEQSHCREAESGFVEQVDERFVIALLMEDVGERIAAIQHVVALVGGRRPCRS